MILIQCCPESNPASPATTSQEKKQELGPHGASRGGVRGSQGAHCARPPVANQTGLPLPVSALAFPKSF